MILKSYRKIWLFKKEQDARPWLIAVLASMSPLVLAVGHV